MIARYTNPEMGRIWSDQRRYETWLAVEIARVLERVEVEIDHSGDRHYMEFTNGGKLTTKLEVRGKAPRGRSDHRTRHAPWLGRYALFR